MATELQKTQMDATIYSYVTTNNLEQ